jgi:hypothetical protein
MQSTVDEVKMLISEQTSEDSKRLYTMTNLQH